MAVQYQLRSDSLQNLDQPLFLRQGTNRKDADRPWDSVASSEASWDQPEMVEQHHSTTIETLMSKIQIGEGETVKFTRM